MKVGFVSLVILLVYGTDVYGQTCTASTQVNTDINITTITWIPDGTIITSATTCSNIIGGTDTTTPANFFVDVANGVTITISNSITINGNFDIPSSATGDNSTLKVDGSGTPITLHVTGDLGDNTNNNIQYDVVAATDHIQVDGTLYGKNNNQFIGNGTISGGALSVKNGTTCGTPCPVSGGFSSCSSGDSFCTNYGVLPILLSSFTASVTNQSVKLKWSTSTEINFDHFVLERSGNGTEFSEITQVKGAGTSTTHRDYSFTDNDPFIGNSYYRLTSIDFDGYTQVFNTNIVRVDVKSEKNFNITPNPIQDCILKGSINFDAPPETHILIFGTMGTELGRFSFSGSSFENAVPNLADGVYFIQLQSGSFRKTLRVVVGK